MNHPSTPQQQPGARLQAKIAELRDKKHLPPEMIALAATVTGLQYRYLPRVAFAGGKESLPPGVLQLLGPREKRSGGLPVLAGKDFPLDMPLVQELARELLRDLPKALPLLEDYVHELGDMLDNDAGLLQAACREILEPSRFGTALPHLDAWAKAHPEAPHFFRFVVTSAAMPSLMTVGRILGAEHDKEQAWPHGHCPVCGNQPLLGRLAEKEGRRMHSCSFCGFEYRAPRLGCPFCLAPENEGAEYYVSDDEPGYLLTACNICKNYFKLADRREHDQTWFPLLEDLSSLTLDLYALQMDYKRPTLSGWGF